MGVGKFIRVPIEVQDQNQWGFEKHWPLPDASRVKVYIKAHESDSRLVKGESSRSDASPTPPLSGSMIQVWPTSYVFQPRNDTPAHMRVSSAMSVLGVAIIALRVFGWTGENSGTRVLDPL
jgi:hypothetical protein